MAHHFAHNTATSLGALSEREQMGSMKEVFAGPGPRRQARFWRRRLTRDPVTTPTTSGATPPRPLEGLKVIDLGTRIGAPFCAGLLGEWGADVIKVEQPGGGDFMRTIGPFAPIPALGTPPPAGTLNVRGTRPLTRGWRRRPQRQRQRRRRLRTRILAVLGGRGPRPAKRHVRSPDDRGPGTVPAGSHRPQM